jgi:hypothetical protein
MLNTQKLREKLFAAKSGLTTEPIEEKKQGQPALDLHAVDSGTTPFNVIQWAIKWKLMIATRFFNFQRD